MQSKNPYVNRLLKVILYIALFHLSFSIRVAYISRFAYWPDEGVQAHYANSFLLDLGNQHVVELAAKTGQPPLDYYLEAAGLYIFGFNEVGMRMHAVILGASACLLFFVFLNKNFGLISAIPGYILFTFNPWLIRYSVEGRPYSLAIFCAVLFIFMFHTFFRNGNFRNFICTVIVQLIFLLSIGIQSIVLIFCFILFSIVVCLLVEGKDGLGKAIRIAISFVLASMLFLPIMSRIIKECNIFIARDERLMHRYITLIQRYSISEYLRFYSLVNDYRYLLLASLIFYILAMFLYKKRKDLLFNGINQLKIVSLGVLFSFPLFYYFIIHLAFPSKSDFRQRYILVFIPVILYVVSVGFKDLISIVEKEIKQVRYKILVYLVITECVVFMFYCNLENNRKFLEKQHPEQFLTSTPSSYGVELNLGRGDASPTTMVKFMGNIPPISSGQRVDVYVLTNAPSGAIYSILDNGTIIRGIKPMKSVTNFPNGWYGTRYQVVIRKGTPTGGYSATLVLMPSGIPLNLSRALAYDIAEISIVE